jgi:hypothetical protein
MESKDPTDDTTEQTTPIVATEEELDSKIEEISKQTEEVEKKTEDTKKQTIDKEKML